MINQLSDLIPQGILDVWKATVETHQFTILDGAVFTLSLCCVVACFCRMDPLLYWRHRFWIILFHATLAMTCVFSAGSAWQSNVSSGDVVIVFLTTTWLLGSLRTWAKGVPPYFRRDHPHLIYGRRATDRHRSTFNPRRLFSINKRSGT